ncbi:hypothetical protein [Gluconacetobacter entanii]|uniref:hypothetical protein n=1 Tax=Gluconacetobacter entanii TaxID=108528 RepID=UPI001C932DC0|nr:hypothetical protein [Gluconacetobacter entanii]MCW4588193.1 hypothetical protein [Gluconacetobacter entanii]
MQKKDYIVQRMETGCVNPRPTYPRGNMSEGMNETPAYRDTGPGGPRHFSRSPGVAACFFHPDISQAGMENHSVRMGNYGHSGIFIFADVISCFFASAFPNTVNVQSPSEDRFTLEQLLPMYFLLSSSRSL